MRVVTLLVFYNIFMLAELRKPKSRPKIVGGVPVEIESYPYQLSLQRNLRHTCGAVLLSSKFATTAAHCHLGDQLRTYSVYGGSKYYFRDGDRRQISRFVLHIRYNNVTFDYDIATLEFETPFNLGSRISPISLPQSGQSIPVGTVATVTGWGVTIENGTSVSPTLLMAQITVVSHAECSEIYKDETTISSRMICAGGQERRGTCQGDSGGPLVATGVLIGITSNGIGCGRLGIPIIYSNVVELLDWIKEHAALQSVPLRKQFRKH